MYGSQYDTVNECFARTRAYDEGIDDGGTYRERVSASTENSITV